MRYNVDERQQAVRDRVKEFGDKEIVPVFQEHDRREEQFSRNGVPDRQGRAARRPPFRHVEAQHHHPIEMIKNVCMFFLCSCNAYL